MLAINGGNWFSLINREFSTPRTMTDLDLLKRLGTAFLAGSALAVVLAILQAFGFLGSGS